MNGFNKVILVGTLGADPKTIKSRDGKEFAALSLATNRFWRNKEGNNERKTDWHRVTVCGKKAGLCTSYLKKGSTVCIEGFLSTYESEENGLKRWNTSITAEEVNFMSPKPKNDVPNTPQTALQDDEDEELAH
jgi:single-strand DNA-binding protein